MEGEKVEAVTDFLFLGSKIIVDGDCSHEINRCLFLGRKAMTNLDSILKSRNPPPPKPNQKQRLHFADKGLYSQSYGFSRSHRWMWKLDHEGRLNTKGLMLSNCGAGKDSLRVPLIARRSNQAIIREIDPEYSLEGLPLKLQFLATWCEEKTH